MSAEAHNEGGGLALSRRFFEEAAWPAILEAVDARVASLAAAGRVGEGSEAWGFDDVVSRDHDWGAGLCVWLPEGSLDGEGLAEARSLITRVVEAQAALQAYPVLPFAAPRFGVLTVEGFYRRFIGLGRAPETPSEWLAVPEPNFAVCTNGAVFIDGPGRFSEIREHLLGYYPVDVRLRRLAVCTFAMGQAGQYNLPRCIRRGDLVAAGLMRSVFAANAMKAGFAVRATYAPFEKWLFRGFSGLRGFGRIAGMLDDLACVPLDDADAAGQCADLVEGVCEGILSEVGEMGLPVVPGGFMVDEAAAIHGEIASEEVARLPYAIGR